MKFITIATLSFLFAAATNQATLQCGQKKIANINNICIQPEYIEGCSKYTDEYNCNTCEDGYGLNNGKCNFEGPLTIDNTNMIGCLQHKNRNCVNCANGFKKIQGKCQYGIKNCEAYNEDGTCKECNIQYSLILNECRHNLVLGCKQELPNHTCKECFAPFVLNNNHCDIANCKVLNDFGCTACECGYYLNPNRSCDKIADGCLRYQRGKCINCLYHYKLKGGSCFIQGCVEYDGQSCSKCDQKYNKVGHGCEFKNCLEWLDDQCLVCKSGFHPKNNICIEGQDQIAVCQ